MVVLDTMKRQRGFADGGIIIACIAVVAWAFWIERVVKTDKAAAAPVQQTAQGSRP